MAFPVPYELDKPVIFHVFALIISMPEIGLERVFLQKSPFKYLTNTLMPFVSFCDVSFAITNRNFRSRNGPSGAESHSCVK